MNVFTFKKNRGCYFTVGKYNNGNLRLDIESPEFGPITKVTMDCPDKLPKDVIAVYDQKENEGIAEFLLLKGIVDRFHSIRRNEENVMIAYHLTEKGKKLF